MNAPQPTKPVPGSIATRSHAAVILAITLAIEMAAITTYSVARVRTLLKPENLADRVETAIEENYPSFREQLVKSVHTQSPELAERVSQELLQTMPTAREELEQFTSRQLDLGLEAATDFSAEQFREFVRDNRDSFEKAFETIEQAPRETHQFVLETEAKVEQRLGADLQVQARQVLAWQRRLNDKLQRLSSPRENLSSQELLERRIVRIVRTMELEAAQELAVQSTPATAPISQR